MTSRRKRSASLGSAPPPTPSTVDTASSVAGLFVPVVHSDELLVLPTDEPKGALNAQQQDRLRYLQLQLAGPETAASAAAGSNFELEVLAMRRRTTMIRQHLARLADMDLTKQTVAEAMLTVLELERHAEHMQQSFETTLRLLRCRAWYGTLNDQPSQQMGPYTMAPLWN